MSRRFPFTSYQDFEGEAAIRIQEENDTQMARELVKTGIREEDHIALDITGFSIPNRYRIMNIFKNVIKIKHLDVYYTEPKFYIYEEGYFDSYHTGKDRRYKDCRYKERRCEPLPGYCNSGRGFPSYTAKLKNVSLFNNEDLII